MVLQVELGHRVREREMDTFNHFLHSGYENGRFRRELTYELTKSSNDSLFMFGVPHGHLHTGFKPFPLAFQRHTILYTHAIHCVQKKNNKENT